jgi:hypothetical protein
MLLLTATRTVLSRVLDPRARHRVLLRREAGQADVPAQSHMESESTRDRKVLQQLIVGAFVGAFVGVRARVGERRRTSYRYRTALHACVFTPVATAMHLTYSACSLL